MFSSTYTRPLGKVMVMLFSLALLCILSVGSPVASAQTTQNAAAVAQHSIAHKVRHNSVSGLPCTEVRSKYFEQFCFTPTVTLNCGANVYSHNDYNNQPVQWTAVNGNGCVKVSYNYTFSLSTCDVYFYVPNGYGDATFKYSLTSGGTIHITYINENNYSNYIPSPIFSPTGSGTMSFTNNDPVGPTLGWGYGASDGLEEDCYA